MKLQYAAMALITLGLASVLTPSDTHSATNNRGADQGVQNFVPKPGSSLYLLPAISCVNAGLSSSYSRIFAPLSQCSTCLP